MWWVGKDNRRKLTCTERVIKKNKWIKFRHKFEVILISSVSSEKFRLVEEMANSG